MKTWLLCGFCLLMLSGCFSSSADELIKPSGGEKNFNRFEFRSQLSRKETATIKDLVLLVSQSYKGRRDKYDAAQWHRAFRKLGWISSGNLEDPCTRGQVGQLVTGRLNLQSNFFSVLLGPTERYGFREVMRKSFLKQGYPNEFIAGSTLMNVQSRATTWVKKDPDRFKEYDNYTEMSLLKVLAE